MQEHKPRNWNSERTRKFRKALLLWYDGSKRELPWRQDRHPYRVWVSEIMLQQTRVAAVVGYYERFLERFPDVHALARAGETSVLAAWSGLGYYRRARALHAAAKVIAGEMAGEFPRTAAEWQRLPGIGRYTAAAIASIAFGEPCAVVDGNVERVLRRLSGEKDMDGNSAWQHAGELLDPKRPGDFNQAMMELGAMVCMPLQPMCIACPVVRWCETRGPGAPGKKQVRKSCESAHLLSARNGAVYLVRRSETSSLMPGMWELPAATVADDEPKMTVKHSITDTDYTVKVYVGKAARYAGGRWVRVAELGTIAVTGLTRKILRRAGIV